MIDLQADLGSVLCDLAGVTGEELQQRALDALGTLVLLCMQHIRGVDEEHALPAVLMGDPRAVRGQGGFRRAQAVRLPPLLACFLAVS
jgi:hypothetical protein